MIRFIESKDPGTIIACTGKYVVSAVILTGLFLCVAAGASEKVMTIPFTAENEIQQAFAVQVTLMLEEKLKLVDGVQVVKHEKLVSEYAGDDGADFDWTTVEDVRDFCEKYGIRYLVLGSVTGVEIVDDNRKDHRWIGVNDYLVEVRIKGILYDRQMEKIIMETEKASRRAVPEITVLGIHRSPIPSTARSIDAVIHEAVLEIVGDFRTHLEDTAPGNRNPERFFTK